MYALDVHKNNGKKFSITILMKKLIYYNTYFSVINITNTTPPNVNKSNPKITDSTPSSSQNNSTHYIIVLIHV